MRREDGESKTMVIMAFILPGFAERNPLPSRDSVKNYKYIFLGWLGNMSHLMVSQRAGKSFCCLKIKNGVDPHKKAKVERLRDSISRWPGHKIPRIVLGAQVVVDWDR